MNLTAARIRRWALAGVLAVATLALAWRIRAVRRAPRIQVSDRVASLMYLRLVSQSIYQYARRYGRPPYKMDSIYAHLDSAQAAVLSSEIAGLWDFADLWTWCDYQLVARTAPPPDSMPEQWIRQRDRPPLFSPPNIRESYTWPPGVGRTTDCTGGPIAIDDSR